MSEPPRATEKELMVLRLLLKHWKEDDNRYAGVLLRSNLPGLAECLEAGWIEHVENVPDRFRLTNPGEMQLRYAGDDVDDEQA